MKKTSVDVRNVTNDCFIHLHFRLLLSFDVLISFNMLTATVSAVRGI